MAPPGPQALLEVQLTLTVLQLLLLADVLPHPVLIQAHRADAVPRRPEVQPRHPALVEPLPVDPHGTLALQEADRMGHAVLGRDAPAQVDVVGHRRPFHQIDPSLTAQLPQDHAYLAPQPGAPPFVRPGDSVVAGQPLLIIEAMKVMNQIRAPRAGRLARILITDADPVEYGAPLMLIE